METLHHYDIAGRFILGAVLLVVCGGGAVLLDRWLAWRKAADAAAAAAAARPAPARQPRSLGRLEPVRR
jgi:hypothetical protein